MMARVAISLIFAMMACAQAFAETSTRTPPSKEAMGALGQGDVLAAYNLLLSEIAQCRARDVDDAMCVDLLLAAGESGLLIGDVDVEGIAYEAAEASNRLDDRLRAIFIVLSVKNLRGDYLSSAPIAAFAHKWIDREPTLDPPLVARMRTALAVRLDGLGLYYDAEKLHRSALDGLHGAEGEQSSDYLISIAASARNLDKMGRYAEAESLWRKALALSHARPTPRHANFHKGLGSNFVARKRCVEAEPLLRLAIAEYGRSAFTYGGRLDLASSLSELGACVDLSGRSAEASELYILAGTQGTFGDNFPTQFLGQNSLRAARNSLNLGCYDSAMFKVDMALINLSTFRPSDHPDVAGALQLRGVILESMKDIGGAVHMYRQSQVLWQRALLPSHPDRLDGGTTLALFLLRHDGAPDEARVLLRDAQTGLLDRISTTSGFDEESQRELRRFTPMFRGQVQAAWRLANRTIEPAARRTDRARPRPRSRP